MKKRSTNQVVRWILFLTGIACYVVATSADSMQTQLTFAVVGIIIVGWGVIDSLRQLAKLLNAVNSD